MKRKKTKISGKAWYDKLLPPKDCKKCIYKNCPDSKSNSGCCKYIPKKGA